MQNKKDFFIKELEDDEAIKEAYKLENEYQKVVKKKIVEDTIHYSKSQTIIFLLVAIIFAIILFFWFYINIPRWNKFVSFDLQKSNQDIENFINQINEESLKNQELLNLKNQKDLDWNEIFNYLEANQDHLTDSQEKIFELLKEKINQDQTGVTEQVDQSAQQDNNNN